MADSAVSVSRKQITLAVKALVQYVNKTASEKKTSLLDEGEAVCVQCAFKQTPLKVKKPRRIQLKYSLYDKDNIDICIITKDPQHDFEELIEKAKIPGRITVLSVSKLRSDFKPYEAKRQLCASYDLFLADDRVLDVLPRLLGKSFFVSKRQPVPIKLTAKDLAAQVARARDATYLFLGRGTCCLVRAGNTSQHSISQLVDNIESICEGFVQHDVRNGKNIQVIHIKTDESIALPIYNSLPTVEDLQNRENIQGKGVKSDKKKKKRSKKSRKRDTEGASSNDTTDSGAGTTDGDSAAVKKRRVQKSSDTAKGKTATTSVSASAGAVKAKGAAPKKSGAAASTPAKKAATKTTTSGLAHSKIAKAQKASVKPADTKVAKTKGASKKVKSAK